MVSYEYNTIMIHIDKCAGVSICNHFKAYHGSHSKWNRYQERWPLEWKNFFKFTFVRNPWDRVVSAYLFHLFKSEAQFYDRYERTQNQIRQTLSQQEHFRVDHKDFNYFLRYNRGLKYKLLSTYSYKFHPCYTFIYDEDMNCQVDFVGRYENLNEDMAYIQEKLGMSIEPIPHVNSTKSKRPHYSVFYNEENIEIVREIYKVDIELFGYEFERVVPYDHTLANTLDWVDKD